MPMKRPSKGRAIKTKPNPVKPWRKPATTTMVVRAIVSSIGEAYFNLFLLPISLLNEELFKQEKSVATKKLQSV